VRIVLEIKLWSFQVGTANNLHLMFEQLRIFLRRVQPILATMWLQFGFRQIAIDLTAGDGFDDATFDNFVG
jgi:hypothetical protein